MNKLDEIIIRLQAQQPELSGADELTDRIMHDLPDWQDTNTLITRRPAHRWAVAAGIAIIFCLGLAAATFFHFAPKADEGEAVAETEEVAEEAPNPDFFVFDNMEMVKVAEILAKHYRLKPVFENEAVKRKRLYLRVEKSRTIQDIAELINRFSGVSITVCDGKLIIQQP